MSQTAPWKRPDPKTAHGRSRRLTAAQKSAAKQRAKRAGRRYPNLVDNMWAAQRTTARKSPTARTRDPRGGLTARGRAGFGRKEGAHLKPGVRKRISDMTPEEMRRKGSWAVRFYGRRELPPLQDAHGKPTRFALSAHAWGEPVPRTTAAARRIAEKGRRLLARYQKAKRG
jgi:hypothetical protein